MVQDHSTPSMGILSPVLSLAFCVQVMLQCFLSLFEWVIGTVCSYLLDRC